MRFCCQAKNEQVSQSCPESRHGISVSLGTHVFESSWVFPLQPIAAPNTSTRGSTIVSLNPDSGVLRDHCFITRGSQVNRA